MSLKVLHVLNGGVGGAALSTLGLIEYLKSLGVESCIYCSERVSQDAKRHLMQHAGVAIHFGPMYFWNARIRKSFWKRPLAEAVQLAQTQFLLASSNAIIRFCLEQSVNLIHSSTIVSPDGALVAHRLGLPHVWHLRELVGPGHHYRLRGDSNGQAAARLLRTGHVIANSDTTRVALFDRMHADRLQTIHNGFDFTELAALAPPADRAEPLTFGLVANLSSTWKRHDVFIRAAALAIRKNSALRFRIYGEIPTGNGGSTEARQYYQGLLQLVASQGLERHLLFRGHQSDVPKLMAEFDVLVHATGQESFGRVFIEAAAAARPAIAVRGGAAEEIIEDGRTGLLVEPDDPAKMAAAMHNLAQDPILRLQLGREARRRAVERFGIDRCGNSIMEVYRAAMNRPPAPNSFLRALVHVLR